MGGYKLLNRIFYPPFLLTHLPNKTLLLNLEEKGFKTHANYLKFVHSDLDTRMKLYLQIESKMGEKKPLSVAEGEMRFALYAFSISLRLSEINSLNREKRISNLTELRNIISKF